MKQKNFFWGALAFILINAFIGAVFFLIKSPWTAIGDNSCVKFTLMLKSEVAPALIASLNEEFGASSSAEKNGYEWRPGQLFKSSFVRLMANDFAGSAYNITACDNTQNKSSWKVLAQCVQNKVLGHGVINNIHIRYNVKVYGFCSNVGPDGKGEACERFFPGPIDFQRYALE